ncbi:variable surface protein [Plasmodium gonderi]|uniref:Variable surface protein n=1 Tax=Plasmodium gonderi TaxID=77519 RepID=A0A1Y1JNJ6_PLAGO|nr:variable surface protein [Plasmodium gonderi]GAW84041.1 variable surface protein [Plasmodium gonderi]
MNINIYEYASLFSACDKNIQQAKHNEGAYKGNCEHEEQNIKENIKSKFKEKCTQTLSYLNEIQQFKHGYNNLEKALCLYLYYWLYDSKTEGMNGRDIKQLYHELIRVNKEEQDPQCTNFMDVSITDNEMLKLKDIHDMYTNIGKINGERSKSGHNCACAEKCAQTYNKYVETCNYNNNTYFCKELLKIKEQYDKEMERKTCPDGIPQILPSFRSYSMTTLTLIPICITLAISSFLFFLYKVHNYVTRFTPYTSSFRCAAMKKRKQYNNIHKEMNILELSENRGCDFRNKNILYI